MRRFLAEILTKLTFQKFEEKRWSTEVLDEAMFKILSWNGKGVSYEEFDKSGKKTADYLQPYLGPSSHIIDWGAGIGRVARHVALNNPTSIVHCVDISKDMIGFGKKYCEGIKNIIWHHWNGKQLAIDQADFVYSLLTFQHNTLKDTRKALNEIARMLRGTALLEFPSEITDDYKVHDAVTVRKLLQERFEIINFIIAPSNSYEPDNIRYYRYVLKSKKSFPSWPTSFAKSRV